MRAAAIPVVAGLLVGAHVYAQREPLPKAPQPVAVGGAKRPVIINGRTYTPPTERDLVSDYLHDTYGVSGWARTSVRALYSQGRGHPSAWPQDWTGFGQRFGSATAVTAINGTTKLGMENLFHEDLRYIPCHGCRWKQKVENALLAEITARHDYDGRRFFTLTPTVSDFSGPILTHTLWYPGNSNGPMQGVIAARVVFATRIGGHLFREFVWERRHHDEPGTLGTVRP